VVVVVVDSSWEEERPWGVTRLSLPPPGVYEFPRFHPRDTAPTIIAGAHKGDDHPLPGFQTSWVAVALTGLILQSLLAFLPLAVPLIADPSMPVVARRSPS